MKYLLTSDNPRFSNFAQMLWISYRNPKMCLNYLWNWPNMIRNSWEHSRTINDGSDCICACVCVRSSSFTLSSPADLSFTHASIFFHHGFLHTGKFVGRIFSNSTWNISNRNFQNVCNNLVHWRNLTMNRQTSVQSKKVRTMRPYVICYLCVSVNCEKKRKEKKTAKEWIRHSIIQSNECQLRGMVMITF